MFDEEKIFREHFPEYTCGKEPLSPYWDLFQEGVCCGYDKAKEWHNIEDEPPPVGETVLVYYGVDALGMAVLATASAVFLFGNATKTSLPIITSPPVRYTPEEALIRPQKRKIILGTAPIKCLYKIYHTFVQNTTFFLHLRTLSTFVPAKVQNPMQTAQIKQKYL